MNKKGQKGQGTMDYLLIVVGAIVIAAIGIVYLTMTGETGKNAVNAGNTAFSTGTEELLGPQADFNANKTEGTIKDTFNFTDLSIVPTGSTITSWNWSFGDGTGSSDQNASHKYSSGDDYTVRLTITDSKGKTSTKGKLVKVTYNTISVHFVGGQNSSIRTVDFEDNSSYPPGTKIIVREWDFGDGSISYGGATISHQYADYITYTATLTVTNDKGEQGTYSDYHTVVTMCNNTLCEPNEGCLWTQNDCQSYGPNHKCCDEDCQDCLPNCQAYNCTTQPG